MRQFVQFRNPDSTDLPSFIGQIMTTEIVLVFLGLLYLNHHSIRSIQCKNSEIHLFIDHPLPDNSSIIK